MLPFFSERFANPASEIHQMGREARQAVDRARSQVAELIGSGPEEILFSSSATESNNLAILGLARSGKADRRVRLLCSAIEHKSVLQPSRSLESEGFASSIVPVDSVGRVHAEAYRVALDDRVLLASIQAANNEIGTIQDISSLSDLAHEYGTVFHCDAAQAVGKIPVDVDALGCSGDLIMAQLVMENRVTLFR
jgi:cysteine desulfurase